MVLTLASLNGNDQNVNAFSANRSAEIDRHRMREIVGSATIGCLDASAGLFHMKRSGLYWVVKHDWAIEFNG